MTVLVATALDGRGQPASWLVAMDGGRVLSAAAPRRTLHNPAPSNARPVFIALLPRRRRRDATTRPVPNLRRR